MDKGKNHKANIMIVEDEKIVAQHIQNVLEDLGYVIVAVAHSGSEAIAEALQKKPNLILMDINLRDGVDGIDAISEIKKNFSVPVVYITAYADSQILQRAKETEPFYYIVKPFEEHELNAAIEIALHNQLMEKKLNMEINGASLDD